MEKLANGSYYALVRQGKHLVRVKIVVRDSYVAIEAPDCSMFTSEEFIILSGSLDRADVTRAIVAHSDEYFGPEQEPDVPDAIKSIIAAKR